MKLFGPGFPVKWATYHSSTQFLLVQKHPFFSISYASSQTFAALHHVSDSRELCFLDSWLFPLADVYWATSDGVDWSEMYMTRSLGPGSLESRRGEMHQTLRQCLTKWETVQQMVLLVICSSKMSKKDATRSASQGTAWGGKERKTFLSSRVCGTGNRRQ